MQKYKWVLREQVQKRNNFYNTKNLKFIMFIIFMIIIYIIFKK